MKTYGVVKWYKESKGFGFVTTDDGIDCFIHFSNILGEGFQTLKENQKVSFVIEQHDRGPWAVDLSVIPPDRKLNDIFHTETKKKEKSDTYPVRSLKVFLCHSTGDKSEVRALYKKLIRSGVDPWFDEEKLLPGQDWNLEIINAVNASDIVLCCLSKNSVNKSGYVQKEIKYALDVASEQPEGSVFVIPTRLEECEIPHSLRKWHWSNLFEENGYEKLLTALDARASEFGLSVIAKREIRTGTQVQ